MRRKVIRDSHKWLVGGSRFLVLFSLAVWLGGIIFLGAVAAPLVFKICRANGTEVLAPQMVGAMVTRFNIALYVCGALLIIGWAGERILGALGQGLNQKLWWAQGACSVLMVLIAVYGGLLVMPRLNELQVKLLPQWQQASHKGPSVGLSVKPPRDVAPALKAEFDAGHQHYQRLTLIGWWLGVGVLLMLSLRTVLPGAHGVAMMGVRDSGEINSKEGALLGGNRFTG